MPTPVELLLARYIRPDVLAMAGYRVQDSTAMLKMDAMENPHRLPENLRAELGQRLAAVEFNRYPGKRVEQLRHAVLAHAHVPDGCTVMLGNGSDELISLLAMACHRPGATVLAPEPGFVMYGLSARLQGLAYRGVSLREDFELDEDAMLAALADSAPAVVYLAYPNNPTANLWDADGMERIIQAAPGLVVVDEAYQPFAGRSFMDKLSRYPQLLLMRTLSKFGLAGVRIGYLAGRKQVIEQLEKVRPPYNVSSVNAECALFALEHTAEFDRQAQAIVSQRRELFAVLGAIPGVRAYHSDANMLLLRMESDDVAAADNVFEGMKRRGVLVRNVSKMHPLLANCLRLTVGTADENRTMVQALRDSL